MTQKIKNISKPNSTVSLNGDLEHLENSKKLFDDDKTKGKILEKKSTHNIKKPLEINIFESNESNNPFMLVPTYSQKKMLQKS